MPNLILLYDGVCGLCDRLVQFLLKRDKRDRLRFASLQSELAQRTLHRHGVNAEDLDTVYVVENYQLADERLLNRSEAILRALGELGGVWKLVAVGKLLPRTLRDLIYNRIARNRYRVFGKFDTCKMPEPKDREKFLDV